MSDALPDPPTIEPGALSAASFTRSRKGFEPTEVRSLLGRVSDALRVWALRDEQLSAEVEELARRAEAAEHLDEARATELLGAETARIVSTARAAAAEIRERAEAEAVASTEKAAQEAARDRELAGRLREEAEARSASMIESATVQAEEKLGTAAREAEAMTEEARRAAEELRTEAVAEAARLLEEARTRHEEMTQAAESVLGERTAEAEAAAEEIRSRARGELAAATKDAERTREAAAADAVAELERARDEARGMLEETRALRHRMLRDLAERRRTARQQTEVARVERRGIVEAIRAAADQLEGTLADLDRREEQILEAASSAAAAVPDDILTVAVELEAELDAGSAGEAVEPVAGAPATDTGQAAEEGSAGSEATDQADPADPGSDGSESDPSGQPPDDGPGGPTTEPAAGPDAAPEDGEPDPENRMASVHDLFERLRTGTEEDEPGEPSEQHPSVGGPIDLTGETDGEVGTELPEPVEPGPSAPVGSSDAGTSPLASVSVISETLDEPGEEAVGPAPAGGDSGLLDRRDEVLAPSERLLARTLKRLVGDEQNEVLDRARRVRRGRVELDELLLAETAERFVSGLSEPYRLSVAAGAQMWCEQTGVPLPPFDEGPVDADLAARVAELLEMRRLHLRSAMEQMDQTGEDLAVLVDHLRAAYRELRATAIPELAADLAIAGFNLGTSMACPQGATWRWVPDNGGLPCSDAEDNSLAGAVVRDEEFPTGDLKPPAHPGCRCMLAPAEG